MRPSVDYRIIVPTITGLLVLGVCAALTCAMTGRYAERMSTEIVSTIQARASATLSAQATPTSAAP